MVDAESLGVSIVKISLIFELNVRSRKTREGNRKAARPGIRPPSDSAVRDEVEERITEASRTPGELLSV